MPSLPSRSPIRTILWLIRGVGVLMLVAGLVQGQSALSEFTAIIALTIVVSFLIEPRLLYRFAAQSGQASQPATTSPQGRIYADVYFAVVVGGMRVVGGLFLLVAVGMAISILSNWPEAERVYGGSTRAIGCLLFLSAFIGIGVLLMLGRHVPLMRALREMGEQARRKS